VARPVKANAEATRQNVLVAASLLFSERGLGRASIRDIASQAGVSLAMIHHYFGSKQDLYQACIDAMYQELEQLRDALESTFLAGGSPEVIVRRAVIASYRFARSHRAAIRLLMREMLDTGEMRADRRERYLLPFLDRGSTVLASFLGQPQVAMRLALQSASHLLVRYALTAPVELALVCGLEEEDTASAVVESHLVDVVTSLLYLPHQSS